jgi:antitoxin HicB
MVSKRSGEYSIRLTVEALPEGQYVATSADLPGLVAQGRTVAETLDIARDVARKLLESYAEHGDPLPVGLHLITDRVELDVAVGNRWDASAILKQAGVSPEEFTRVP